MVYGLGCVLCRVQGIGSWKDHAEKAQYVADPPGSGALEARPAQEQAPGHQEHHSQHRPNQPDPESVFLEFFRILPGMTCFHI